MMQQELLLPSWLTFNILPFSTTNHDRPCNPEMNFYRVNDSDFSYSFASPEKFSGVSSNLYVPTMFSDEFLDLQNLRDEIPIISPMEGLETISSGEIEDFFEWKIEDDNEAYFSSTLTMEEDEWSPSFSLESSKNSVAFPLTDMPLILPVDEELDNQMSLFHLLKAYGEAMEKREKELAMVIVKSINEKSSPIGNTMERIAYNLFQSRENQGEYLRQESSKNFIAAFKVFYQSLPHGRFAHFTANSVILESMPDDATIIHIVDFDMGEGIQWPPMIEALNRKHKKLRLTSIKSPEECNSSSWDFEETKKRLQDHSRKYDLKLQIEEKSIEDLAIELLKMKKSGRGREWLTFNCMVGLPHMGRRKRSRVTEFLKIAKELLANFAGIVILGDGEAWESSNSCSSFTSFFDKLLRHYQALFESLERNFPVYLEEARTAMESLFLAPFMCSFAWFEDWEEIGKGYNLQAETGLECLKLSQESMAEAKQMICEGENSYKVKIEGMRENEMVLEWNGTPLVRVSKWM